MMFQKIEVTIKFPMFHTDSNTTTSKHVFNSHKIHDTEWTGSLTDSMRQTRSVR